jgi:hypothetical protein
MECICGAEHTFPAGVGVGVCEGCGLGLLLTEVVTVMAPAAVSARGTSIAAAAREGDYEAAHSERDALFADVLLAIAAGAPGAVELAREALRVEAIAFARRCA